MRVDYATAFPNGFEAMLSLEKAVRRAGLEPALLELVKLRASQLNGCAYCLDMHSKDARARGEDEQRLHVLAAWREAPFYSLRERAALAWCEALVARLGQLEQAAEAVVPADGQAGAREGNLRPGARRAGGRVRGAARAAGHHRRSPKAGRAEHLRV